MPMQGMMGQNQNVPNNGVKNGGNAPNMGNMPNVGNMGNMANMGNIGMLNLNGISQM